MIEVLKRGTRKQCVCEHCGAELSYEEKDIKNDKKGHALGMISLRMFQTGKSYPSKYIICPQCKHPIAVEVNEND